MLGRGCLFLFFPAPAQQRAGLVVGPSYPLLAARLASARGFGWAWRARGFVLFHARSVRVLVFVVYSGVMEVLR